MSPEHSTGTFSREHALALDAADPLRSMRDRFDLPPDGIYLDGNSLGPLPRGVAEAVATTVRHAWGTRLIRSWNEADWFASSSRVGALVAPLIGASPHEVVVCDSLSVNLFKCMAAALRIQAPAGRRTIVSEVGNFPSDAYINQGIARTFGATVVDVDPADVASAIAGVGKDLAVVQLTHAHYKTGEVYDMAAITELTHRHGGLAVWDLAHSAGAMPVELNYCNADFAAGCTYKYLNGGPGAPGFVFTAERHHDGLSQPMSGWCGHANPFAFDHAFTPAAGMGPMLVGTPPILAMVALEEALRLWDDVDMQQLRAKSMAMGDLFIRLADDRLHTYGFGIASPRDATQRGSQVSLTHPEGFSIMQALIARNIIGDFRAPEILRFGFTPLYLGYADVWDAIDALVDVMKTGEWDHPEFRVRHTVT